MKIKFLVLLICIISLATVCSAKQLSSAEIEYYKNLKNCPQGNLYFLRVTYTKRHIVNTLIQFIDHFSYAFVMFYIYFQKFLP